MSNYDFIKHMPEVEGYRASLDSLSERWNLLTLLGKMSNIGMDMSETRQGFQELTDRLLDRLGDETLDKLTSEMKAKAQVAVDIVIRNLFERTADIGFLATDEDIRRFLIEVNEHNHDEESVQHRKGSRTKIVEHFKEYVAKYSVYSNIILLDTDGNVLAQLDESNDISYSKAPIIQQALHTASDYVESYCHSDLQEKDANTLIYAYRVNESNEPGSPSLGVLCLIFKFEDEMEGVFDALMEESDWMEIMLLDKDCIVISSSDPYHVPNGAKLKKIIDKDFQLVRFAGRQYLAKTCATQGYEGFKGLGWYGHVMIPIDSAFREVEEQSSPRVSEDTLQRIVTGSTLFSNDLVEIPLQADRIQHDLNMTVWNGNVQIANTKSGDNSFSKTLLNEISKTGEQTKQLFENSISNLNQTVISSFLDIAEFHAKLAVDIMDRNLYERANDVRWWALNSRFKKIMAQDNIDEQGRSEMSEILAYINNLYTVYTNLFIYDKYGTISAVSKQEEEKLIGKNISEEWVNQTLSLRDSQSYSVSKFSPSHLYNGKSTYIYGASITDPESGKVNGGIGIVFDSEPQFHQILVDSLPRNETGSIISGCFGVFIDRNKNIIASTNDDIEIGSRFEVSDSILKIKDGSNLSEFTELNDKNYVLGAQLSFGYREYKVSDQYSNDIIAIMYIEVGECSNAAEVDTNSTAYRDYKYPKIQGDEETIEISTFRLGERLFGIESIEIECSLNHQEITFVPGSDERYLGIIFHEHKPLPVISLRKAICNVDGYNQDEDSIIVLRSKDENGESHFIGLVIDQIMDSPEIPRRLLMECDVVAGSKRDRMTKYVIQSENNSEAHNMLLVLDIESISAAIFSDDEILLISDMSEAKSGNASNVTVLPQAD